MTPAAFRFGDWQVDPAANSLTQAGAQSQLEPRAMQVLVALADHAGEVVSTDRLLETCWGSNIGGDNPVHKTIAQLRKALGDTASAPRYIETIRKRGYRTVAPVQHRNEALSASWTVETPFRGLAPFEERHSAVFFGRAGASEAVLRALARQHAGGRPMVLVLGPSGSGKTSLIRAGVLPRLREGSAAGLPPVGARLVFDCADLDQTDLYRALASVLLDADGPGGAPLFEHDSAATLGQRLVAAPDAVVSHLVQAATATATATAAGGRPVALFIDRFEALLHHAALDGEAVVRFVGLLEQLAGSGAAVVLLACRNDFYPQLAAIAPLMALKARGGHVDLAAPSGAEVAQMVRLPARAANLHFGKRKADGAMLDDELCAAARASPDTLPLLQYCLEELYRQRGDDGELRFSIYQQLGGIEGAIGARAEQVLGSLTAPQQAALPHVLALLVQVDEDGAAVTARPAPWSALATPAAGQLVKALVDARLFTSTLQGGAPVFGLTHEALLRRWPRVVDWVDSHRQSLQVRTRLAMASARWEASGRRRDLLLPRGIQAKQARTLRDDPALTLAPQQRAFIDASLHRVRQGERIRASVIILLIVLTVLAAGLSIAARTAQRAAEQHRLEAESLMGFMLGDFVERLRPLGRLDLLDSISNRALAYLAAGDHDGSAAALAQRAKALQVLSEVKMARGDGEGARAALLLGQDILRRQLEAAPGDTALLKSAGANAFYLGQLMLDKSDWPQAQHYMSAYLGFANRQAAAAPHDPDGAIEQAYAHTNLGSVAMELDQVDVAVREFAVSVALKQAALARNPANEKLAADLANALSWQANAQVRLGQLDKAASLYEQEAAITARLHARTPANAEWALNYSFARWLQGELDVAMGRQQAARARYRESAALLQKIAETDVSNLDTQFRWLHAEIAAVAVNSYGQSDRAAAAAMLRLLERARALNQREAKPRLLRLLGLAGLQAARLVQGIDAAQARALILGSVAHLSAAHAAAPADRDILTTLAPALLLQAELADPALAARASARAVSTLAPLLADSRDFHVLAPWVEARLRQGAADKAVAAAMAQLDAMGYRDIRYRHFLSTHPVQKDSP